jgi:hypothetical protein
VTFADPSIVLPGNSGWLCKQALTGALDLVIWIATDE